MYRLHHTDIIYIMVIIQINQMYSSIAIIQMFMYYRHNADVLCILRPSSNRSPNIFTLVQKVKNRVDEIHAFTNETKFCGHSANYFI